MWCIFCNSFIQTFSVYLLCESCCLPIKEFSPVNSYHFPIRRRLETKTVVSNLVERNSYWNSYSAVQIKWRYEFCADCGFLLWLVISLFLSICSFGETLWDSSNRCIFLFCIYVENVAFLVDLVRWLVPLAPIGKHFFLRLWERAECFSLGNL